MTHTTDVSRPLVIMTTDGAARGNPGPGGWAALLRHGDRERLLTGEAPDDTTNNAMEMMALIRGLESLRQPCRVIVRADSTYVIEGLQRLLAGGRLPVKNRALWEQLVAAAHPHELLFEWVKGHSGDPGNERVNEAANAAATRAYLASEARRAPAPAHEWALAICSPGRGRPVRWALRAPGEYRSGSVAAKEMSAPTAMYQALINGLEAAQSLAAGSRVMLAVITNYELLVKQGRGEWQVKNSAQQGLAAHAAELRRELGAIRFEFASTNEVLALLDQSLSAG